MFGFIWSLITLPFRLVFGLIRGTFGLVFGIIGGIIGLVFFAPLLFIAVPALVIFCIAKLFCRPI